MKVSCESYLPQLQHPRKTEEEVHLPWHSCSSANRLECFALENYTFLTDRETTAETIVYDVWEQHICQGFSNTAFGTPFWKPDLLYAATFRLTAIFERYVYGCMRWYLR
jgi:hypothetical protein